MSRNPKRTVFSSEVIFDFVSRLTVTVYNAGFSGDQSSAFLTSIDFFNKEDSLSSSALNSTDLSDETFFAPLLLQREILKLKTVPAGSFLLREISRLQNFSFVVTKISSMKTSLLSSI